MRHSVSSRLLAFAGGAALAALLVIPARAQDPDDLKRGVARVSLINGDVSVRRGDSGDWVAAALNAPLMSEDRVVTGPNSRAEVQFDQANFLRVGADAEVRMAQIEDRRYQAQIARGTVTFRVLRDYDSQVEVDTPSVSVRPTKKGIYRITVGEAGESEITVRTGDVDIYTARGSERLTSGRTMLVRGTAADPEFQVVAALASDQWDRWNESRDRELERSDSYRYVGSGVYGVEDLDANGDWVNIEEYGYCWRPRVVSAGWAPYQNGRWVWEDWYGWTWVSYDPWGWAPYHYGRWTNHAGSWYWYPGGMGGRHYWSPALVAFFGFGGGHLSVGLGNVGWVPLAPHEQFHPWWGRSYYGGNTYVNNRVNITNVNVTTIYSNARVRNGVTAVGAGDFSRGRFNNTMRVSGDQLREASLVRGQVPIAPGADHLRYSDRQVTGLPRSQDNQRFFSRTQPSGVQRVPFSDQRRNLEQVSRWSGVGIANPGGGAATPTAGRGSVELPGMGRRDSAPNNRVNEGSGLPQAGGTATNTGRGWRTVGEAPGTVRNEVRGGSGSAATSTGPAAGDGANQRPAIGQPPVQRNNSGNWRRFNEGAPSAQGQTTPGQGNSRTADRPASPDRNTGWDRFGTPGGESQRQTMPVDRAPRFTGQTVRTDQAPATQERSRTWNGFGDPGASATPRSEAPATPRQEFRSSPRTDSNESRNAGAGRAESLRIAPPVVRERPSQPRVERPSGGASSAPRGEARGSQGSARQGGGQRNR